MKLYGKIVSLVGLTLTIDKAYVKPQYARWVVEIEPKYEPLIASRIGWSATFEIKDRKDTFYVASILEWVEPVRIARVDNDPNSLPSGNAYTMD